ncbi:MAG TPA: AAA family ATPase [Jiangellales bacterium]|nr:AAA family ATPase [Jiangellales bacterium]
MIVGRDVELARVNAVVSAARHGATDVVVLRGEAGIGKTALLEQAAMIGSDLCVLSARAVESESALPFALASALARPLMRYAGALPQVQTSCLRAALGEDEGGKADDFLLGAALLGLLTEAAREKPVLLLLDDVHWADELSLRAVVFALRRLERDAVGAVIACRDVGVSALDGSGLAVVCPSQLDAASVTALVAQVTGRAPAAPVAEALARSTGGNPLALVELARALDEAVLSGRAGLPEPLPVAGRLLDAYARQVRDLPVATRRALLVAACSEEAIGPIVDAVVVLGGEFADFEEAERAGLVAVAGGRIGFVHPLMRTAVLSHADVVDRRAAHRGLARSELLSPEARAWHMALAASGPDDEAASALAEAADSAANRCDHASATLMWSRASDIVRDPVRRVRMLTDAAEAAMAAGQADRCRALAESALRETADPHLRGRLLALTNATETDPQVRHSTSIEAATLLAPYEAVAAMQALALSLSAGVAARSAELIRTTVDHARSSERTSDPRSAFLRDCIVGTGLALIGNLADALPSLWSALDAIQRERSLSDDPAACSDAIHVAGYLGEVELARSLVDRAVRSVRRQGTMPMLADLLAEAAEIAQFHGDWRRAEALFSEAADFFPALGDEHGVMLADAWLAKIDVNRGDSRAAAEAARRWLHWAEAHGISQDRPLAVRTLAMLDIRNARPELALRRLLTEATVPFDGRGVRNGPLSLVDDLVEAALLAGNGAAAEESVNRLSSYAQISPDPLASALAARCRAQLADGDHALAEFQTALDFHQRDPDPFATARTRLCFGEWLRRKGRRSDAREQLYAALEVFERLDAVPWSDRARAELRATGETVGRRDNIGVRLTAQELRIAMAIAEGITNREAAERLFVSVKTVEFHLSAVFRKLGVSSRTQLARHPLVVRTS